MKKWIFIGLITLTGTLSCQKSGSELLPVREEKLVDVLFDLYLLQARVQNQIKKDSTLQAGKTVLLDYHQISEQQYDSCMILLKRDPEFLAAIQRQVEEKISRFEKSLSSK